MFFIVKSIVLVFDFVLNDFLDDILQSYDADYFNKIILFDFFRLKDHSCDHCDVSELFLKESEQGFEFVMLLNCDNFSHYDA